MIDAILWLFSNIAASFYNVFFALTHPQLWLDWSDGESLMRFVYYGASKELLFAVMTAFVLVTVVGLWRRPILWGFVRVFEGINNAIGRLAAWAGLIMVLQQIMIVFLQRIFRVSEISIGPFGTVFTRDLSWFGEELKLYNAMIVALCVGYTFIQGGHVRVDLVYAGVSRRTKKLIDMAGVLLFMLPAMFLTWLYAWFFLWRHLINPKVSASDTLELMMRKAAIVRWQVETIAFSPNGFDAYFLFKVLIVSFVALVIVQGFAFFWRSLLELIEGPESEGKHLDRDMALGSDEPGHAAH